MASRKILVQLDIQAASSLTSPLSGFVGFSAKADGLYQKIGTAPELRLLTSADVQNAILADGSITGAVSQAQIFTMGVKLYNLTQGYIPYASDATKLLSNSPIYTDGTSVGIGTDIPYAKLDVRGNLQVFDIASSTSPNLMLINNAWQAGFKSIVGDLVFMYNGINEGMRLSDGNLGIGTTTPGYKLDVNGTYSFNKPSALVDVASGIFGVTAGASQGVLFVPSDLTTNNGYFKFSFPDGNSVRFNSDYDGHLSGGKLRDIQFGSNAAINMIIKQVDGSGNVGIGTNPNDKLDVLGKIRATTDNSSYANFYAVSNGGQYPRAFYGIKGDTGYDNVGFTVANDSNDTTERRAYFSASTLSNAAAATAHSIVIQIYPTYGEIYAGQESGSENLPLYLYSGSNNLLNGLILRPTSVSGASAINVGIGTMYPTASLHIKEGTATAGTAPLKLTLGVNLTTPEVGAIEFSSSRLYFTPSSTRETVAFLSDITTASHAPITIGEIGSAPNSNGITLIGQVLNLEPASALYGGVVTTGTQTLAGAKTLSSLLTASAGIANNGSYTQTGTSANTFTGNSTFAGLTITGTILGDTDSARNLMANNVYTYGLAGYQYTNGRLLVSGSLNRMVLSRESFYETNRAKTLTHGYYSVSFWYKVESYTSGTALAPNLNDVALATLNVSGNKAWTFYSSTVYMTTTSFGFLDIEGTFGSTVTISDIMIVRSAKTPQQYVLAPEDIIQYDSTGNVGIGIPAPNQQLEITKNFRLPSTAGTTPYGIIYKGTAPFIHDFNYGNNGTVTTDGLNTFVGINAGNLTMGSTANETYHASYNTGFGFQSLYSNTTGFHNTAVGFNSLQSNTTGYQNTANGYASLSSNTTGHQNTANGVYSLYLNTTGYQNTANGVYSLYLNTIGSNNTALGYNSGSYLADGTTGRTTGNNGLYLGLNSKASANGTDNEIVIGYNAIGVGSNKTVIGNSSVTDTYFGSSTGSSKLWASALNLSGLTASKVVFTDGSKNLTSTGIGTASQFIKGDGSLDSNTYLTTGTTIHTGSGVDGRVTFWNGSNSLSSSANLTWDNTSSRLFVNSISLSNSFKLGTSTTAGYVLTTDAYGNGMWQAPTGSLSGFVPYTGANDNVNLGTHNLSCNEISATSTLTVGNTDIPSYTDGGLFKIATPSSSYAGFDFYSKDTYNEFGVVSIVANPEEGINLYARTNNNSSNSYLDVRYWELGFYTNSQKRLEIAQNGSINAFGNTITSTGGFIGNASTATKLQTARTITIGGQSLSFDGSQNLTYSLSGIGIPVGTASQYIRGDLSLATFPTIHTGNGFNGGVTFWNEVNSLSAAGELTWNNTTKNLSVIGGVSANNVSSNTMSTNSLSTNSFRLIATTTAGYVLTTDANGNGTWQAPTGGGGSYTLPTASASVLGCVKIGSGITISSGVISVSTNYEAPLTFSSGLTRTGNTISFAGSSSYVPYTGATSNVNIGSYVMYANNFILNSDINLKCNIESIEIKNIDIDYKKYEFKSLVGDIRYGVIAQELLKVAPELVSSTPNNTFSVKYIDLLIHEIAYLKQEIKKLTGGN